MGAPLTEIAIQREFHNNNLVNPDLDNLEVRRIVEAEQDIIAPRNSVIKTINLCKSYRDGQPVLNNLCMEVQRGTIYSLLGNSGCGKTTLLNILVGLSKWDSGRVHLFSRRPSGPPGKRVGFMQQDVALYQHVAIREILRYYGRLHGISRKDIEARILWLVAFLKLPQSFQLIRDLSGGQQRRVSLAISLLHCPQLLILDEPTVGLDPLLRESIWHHLKKIVRDNNTTVVVTTHYIEETRLSDRIGVMRNGRLLVQDSPASLLYRYGCELLGDVILKLCHMDEARPDILHGSHSSNECDAPASLIISSAYQDFRASWRLSRRRRSSTRFQNPEWKKFHEGSTLFSRVLASCQIIWLLFYRHYMFLVMVLLLPSIQILVTLMVVGTHPHDLKFGVINDEMDEYDYCFKNFTQAEIRSTQSRCDTHALSCTLVEEFSRSGIISPIALSSDMEARELVSLGKLWGYFHFPRNYSENLERYVMLGRFAGNEVLEGIRVGLWIDMSNYIAAAAATKEAFDAYSRFQGRFATQCHLDPRVVQVPLLYREPVYGRNDVAYQDNVMIIILHTVLLEVPQLVTSIIFMLDRNQGSLGRGQVAGLRFQEVMLSHAITQGLISLCQSLICYLVIVLLYGFSLNGAYIQYIVICFLTGLAGSGLGLVIGVAFRNEVEAVVFSFFLGPILLLYEGALWPVEGMAAVVRKIASIFPTTLVIKSLKSAVFKGVGFLHGDVWPGILILMGWAILFWVVSFKLFQSRK